MEKIFNDDACNNLTSDSKPFWILARAVRDFVRNEGQGALPLRGSIPDMTADSERYIALQGVYKGQAQADIVSVTAYIHQILQTLGKVITDMTLKIELLEF